MDYLSMLPLRCRPHISCIALVERTWLASDASFMSKRRHHVILHLGVFRNFLELIFDSTIVDLNDEQDQESICFCEGGVEKNPRQTSRCQTVIRVTNFSILP